MPLQPHSALEACLAVLSLAFWSACAIAGPPFATDDPQPTDLGHWEIYNFVAGANAGGTTAGEAGLDLNYGAARDLQLTAVLPAAFDAGGRLDVSVGDVEVAAKYKLLHQSGAGVDLALFPRIFLPTATERHGDHSVGLLLPVWLQKDFGPWSLFGGGGYSIGGSRDSRNHWVSGAGVTRQIGERLLVGAELYHHGSETPDARPFTGANLGVAYRLGEHWSLLGSAGPGLENAREEGRYAFYAALKADF